MKTIFTILLILHILNGAIAILAGTINLIRTKGGKSHRQVGKIYLIAMLTSGISSLILARMHPNNFLFMVGIFTIYLVGSGYRYIKRNNKTFNIIDWILSIGMAVTGIFLIGNGIMQIINHNFFGAVFIAFGGIGVRLVYTDYLHFTRKITISNFLQVNHIIRITASYIAALTAFIVVNAQNYPILVPSVILWLLPTAALTPLIIFWARKYSRN